MLTYKQVVKYIHLAVAVPALLFVGCKGLENKEIPQYVYVMLMVMGAATLLHHSEMLPLNKVLNMVGIEHFNSPRKHRVEIVNSEYRPQHMHVRLGDTVEWVNRDTSLHTVSSFTDVFDKELEKDEVYSFTFGRPGIYNYYSKPHPYMKGTLSVVQN